jgi:hypothetical protein
MKLAALGESATCVRLVPSNSKKWLGVLKTPGGFVGYTGLAITSTLPFGSKQAGPSATAKWLAPGPAGKSPATPVAAHVLVAVL